MPLTNAEHQARYRAKQAALLTARTEALQQIITALAGNDKTLAVKVRGIAEAALKGK